MQAAKEKRSQEPVKPNFVINKRDIEDLGSALGASGFDKVTFGVYFLCLTVESRKFTTNLLWNLFSSQVVLCLVCVNMATSCDNTHFDVCFCLYLSVIYHFVFLLHVYFYLNTQLFFLAAF